MASYNTKRCAPPLYMGGFNTKKCVTRFRKNNISMSFKFKWATKLEIFILFYVKKKKFPTRKS